MLNYEVKNRLYIEAEGNNAIGSAVQKLTENGMDILEVQTGKKRRVHRLTISLKNTPNMKREEILKLVEKIEGIKFVKYIY